MNKTEAKKILQHSIGPFSDMGGELLFQCPACGHRKRKFSVNLDKNVYKCWICSYRGRDIRRVVRRFGSYVQLQRWDAITDRTDISRFSELFMEKDEDAPEDIKVDLPEEFVSLANKGLSFASKRPLRYLAERGVTREQIIRWKIGYCYDGEYGGRIIVPSFGPKGYLNYFVARSFVGHRMKYRNPRSSKNIAFNDLFTNWNDDLVIVEGVFDAIRAGNSVPILGSTLRRDSDLLRKIVLNDTPCYVALDPDAAEKERKIITTLMRYDVELYKIDVSGYDDIACMTQEVFEQRKKEATSIDPDSYMIMDMLSAI
jgi:hypothetical protein